MGGAPLLKPESVEALTTNAIDDLRVNAVGPGWGFGLGVAVLKDPVLAESPEVHRHVEVGRRLWSLLVRRSSRAAVRRGADQYRRRRHERPLPGWHPRCRLWGPAVVTHPDAPGKPARSG